MRKTLEKRYKNCSEEFFYNYWENKEFTPKVELPAPDSYYFILDWAAPFSNRPDTLITYGKDVFFAAGYIKYLALGLVGMHALLTDEQYDDFYEGVSGAPMMDVDEILEKGKRKNLITWKVKAQIIAIKRICEQVFLKKTRLNKLNCCAKLWSCLMSTLETARLKVLPDMEHTLQFIVA